MAPSMQPLGHVRVTGLEVTAFTRQLLRKLAVEAGFHTLPVFNVPPNGPHHASLFYKKHVVEAKPANYKNPAVRNIIDHARALHKQGQTPEAVKQYLTDAILHVPGGPRSVSMHLGVQIFTEVFDVAHYSGPTNGPG